jgi:hypothetical protein
MHHNTTEYSVAYFGFEDYETMKSFVAKYDNFVVDDQRRKYVL